MTTIDDVYLERNRVVALAARLATRCGIMAHLAQHCPDDTTWDKMWMNIVVIELPNAGQVTWHIHENDLPLFEFLPRFPAEHYKYDGHTTEEKYARIIKYLEGGE